MQKSVARIVVLVCLLAATVVQGQEFPGLPAVKLVVNGAAVSSDAAPVIINGRVYVPLRVVAEALGAQVSWDAGTYTVSVSQGSSASDKPPRAAETPPAKDGWRTVTQIMGTGSKQSPRFRVNSGEWRIRTEVKALRENGWAMVQVFDEGTQYVTSFDAPAGHEVSYIHEGPGRFYVQVVSMDVAYSFIVEEPVTGSAQP